MRADMTLVKARKDRIAGDSNRGVTQWLEGMEHVKLIRGHARFVDPHAIAVNGEDVSAGDEAVHVLLDVMYAKKPYTVISRAVHIHPTVSELIPTVLQELSPL